MTAPRLVAAMAALFITLRLPLPVTAHDSHASSIQQPHPGRALAHVGQPLAHEDTYVYPVLAARDAAASPEDIKAGVSDSMLALLTAAYIEKRAAEAAAAGLNARQVPEGFPPEGEPDVAGSGSGSGSGSTYAPFDPYAGAPLGSDGLSDILPVPTTWPPGPTFPQTTAEAEVKTDVPSSAASADSSAATSAASSDASAVTSVASSEPSHAVSSDAVKSYSGMLTAPAPRPTTAKTPLHHSYSSTRVTGVSGRVVPASTAIITAVRTTGTPTAATTAPAKESTGAAASLVMAGVPGGLLGTVLVSLGLYML